MTTTLKNAGAALTPDEWAHDVNSAYRMGAAAFVEAGRILNAAKAALGRHGDWLRLISKLQFNAKVAQRLMKVAKNPFLANGTNSSLLPGAWESYVEMARLPVDVLQQKVEAGEIGPATTTAQIKEMRFALAPPKASAAERAGVVEPFKGSKATIASETKTALEEATDWVRSKADEGDMPLATVISWFEQFETEQFISVLRTGSLDEASERSIETVLRHLVAEVGLPRVAVALDKISQEDGRTTWH